MLALVALLTINAPTVEGSVEVGFGGVPRDGNIARVAGSAFMPKLSLRYDSDPFLVTLDVGAVRGERFQDRPRPVFRMGNAIVTGNVLGSLNAVKLSAGFGFAIPTASVRRGTNSTPDRYAYFIARAANGFRDVWAWTEDVFVMFLPIKASVGLRHSWAVHKPEAPPPPWDVVFAVDGALGLFIPTTRSDQPFLRAQFGAELRLDLDSIDPGVKLQFGRSSGTPLNGTQLSLAPFVEYQSTWWVVRARAVFSLFEPLGFGGSSGGALAGFVSAGVRTDL